jgi:uncharacterized protein
MNKGQFKSIYNAPSVDLQADTQRAFINRVYGWMTLGLVLTTVAALIIYSIDGLALSIVSNPLPFYGLMGGELLLVVALSALIKRLSTPLAALLFALYAVLNGITFSMLLLIYTASSVAITFGITACTFGIMTLFGYTTQRDLTKLGNLALMALIGLILASVVNIFLNNSVIYWITTYLGILIFVGLIAYDTQKLKRMSMSLEEGGDVAQKASIMGALALYLDFINLFLMLIRIFGRRK